MFLPFRNISCSRPLTLMRIFSDTLSGIRFPCSSRYGVVGPWLSASNPTTRTKLHAIETSRSAVATLRTLFESTQHLYMMVVLPGAGAEWRIEVRAGVIREEAQSRR